MHDRCMVRIQHPHVPGNNSCVIWQKTPLISLPGVHCHGSVQCCKVWTVLKQEIHYLNKHAVLPKKCYIIKMLRTCVVDLKQFHLDRTGNCRKDTDVNGVYRPKGLDKEENIWTHTKCEEILNELGKLHKKAIAAQNTSTKPTVKKTVQGQRSQSPTASLTYSQFPIQFNVLPDIPCALSFSTVCSEVLNFVHN